jgi:hypothetical protein
MGVCWQLASLISWINVLAGEFASFLGNIEEKSATPPPLSPEKRSPFYEAGPKSL